MEIISLVCPSCGAQLEVNPRLKQGVCNYCGSSFMIDDQKTKIELDDVESIGYEFERGRFNAQNDGADPELIEAVGALIEPVCELSNLYLQEKSQKGDIKTEEDRVSFLTSDAGKYIPAGGVAAVVMFFAFVLISECGAGVLLGGIILAAGLFAAVYFLQPLCVESMEKSIEGKKRRLEDLKKEIKYFESVLEKYDVNIIPESYRSREAMTFIYNALKNKRAITIQQAVNLLEEEKRLQKEREMQERQLKLQEEQLRLQREQLDQMQEAEEQRRADERNTKIAGAVATGAIVAGGAILSNEKARKAVGKAAGKAAGAVLKGIIGL